MEERSYVSLVKEFLSIKGESLQQFAAELKKLTAQDKADLIVEFEKMGYVIKDAAPAA